jgi:Zn-dependent protease
MVRIGRLAGIPVGIHPLWLVVVALISLSLGAQYYPDNAPGISSEAAYLLGLLSALTLFAGIVAHEFGHALVARRHGVEIEEIDLWLLGGVARMRGESPSAHAELRFAAAGPAVTAVLLAVFALLRYGLGSDAFPDWLRAFIEYQVYVNAAILVLNLIPAFPLDGGRLLHALLWERGGDRDAATEVAGRIGAAFGWGFVALGFVSLFAGAPAGLWFALIGGFIVLAARAERERAALEHHLHGVTVADLMEPDPVTVPEWLTADGAIASRVGRHLFQAFPVIDGEGRAAGLLTLDCLRAVPPPLRSTRRVGEIAMHDPALTVRADADVAELMMRPAFAQVGRAVVVDERGEVIGLVSATEIQRRLRRADLLLPRAA